MRRKLASERLAKWLAAHSGGDNPFARENALWWFVETYRAIIPEAALRGAAPWRPYRAAEALLPILRDHEGRLSLVPGDADEGRLSIAPGGGGALALLPERGT